MLKLVVLLASVAASWSAEVCCPDIGCFNDNSPFDGLPLPWCMNQVNPHYTMYTRSNPNAGQSFDHNSVPGAYSGGRRTVFIAHGYQSSGSSSWLPSMKNAFLDREDINVVIVDWQGGADIVNYNQAASNTRTTGAYTALVVNNLVSNGGASSRMWCVGHSLGSHVCGHTGMKTSLGRVTGMDPAGPSFESNSNKLIGLNPSSASFVDVIHSDTTTYGTLRDIGHVDFYPAGGSNQPGCVSDIAGCSHSRAHEYMENSIRDDCFQSRSSCSNYNLIPGSCSGCTCGTSPCAYMGYAADSSCQNRGIYYLEISANQPYCVS
jgi:pancreatic lipase-related protein 1